MDFVVPGSVANLGGGFDTLAVAVQLYLRLRIVDIRDNGGASLTVVSSRPAVTGRNAIERAFASLAKQARRPVPSVFVEVESDVPMSAGLGSSAAAAVAGVRVFEHVTEPMSDGARLAAVTALEGHADNAAAALFGGLTSVVESGEHVYPREPWRQREPIALRWAWPEELRLVVATPSVGLSTSKARAALPDALPRADAVYNLQRVVALVHALQSGNYEGIREAVRDRWHQPVRAALVPQLDAILALDDPEVFGAFLSGAGPSVALLARRDFGRIQQRLEEIYERAGSTVTIRTLAVHQSSQVMPAAVASAHGRTV